MGRLLATGCNGRCWLLIDQLQVKIHQITAFHYTPEIDLISEAGSVKQHVQSVQLLDHFHQEIGLGERFRRRKK